MTRKLLSIGQSYVIGVNRRLAEELARMTGERWEVTIANPRVVYADFRTLISEPLTSDTLRQQLFGANMQYHPTTMVYHRELKELIRSQPWDLIHVWQEPYTFCSWQIGRWAHGRAPIVYYTFQNLAKRYPWVFRTMERASVNRATGWIAGTKVVEDVMLQKDCYAQKPHTIIPLGVDCDYFRHDAERRGSTLQKLGWSADGAPIIGYLGRLVPEKGIPFFLKVLDGLPVPYRVLFVGRGPLETEIRTWSEKHPERVAVVTDAKHSEVPAYLSAMDLLVAPSLTTRTWKEQLGRMILEAFAGSVPVIANESGEIPHVVRDCGIVVKEDDLAGWIEQLTRLLTSPELRRELAGKGLERARTVFDWPIIAADHDRFFEQILATKQP